MKNYDLQQRLAYCLLACRLSVFIVFLVWTYNKLLRPEHGVHIVAKFYYISDVPESIILAFAAFELIMCGLLLLGLYQRFVRGFFLLLSVLAVAMPQVVLGYIQAITVEAHPTILYFTGFCLLACSIALYTLRDYDTLLSFSKNDRSKNHDLVKKVGLYLAGCRFGVFIVFFVWTLNKLLRPEFGAGIMSKHYFIGGISETAIFLFGVFELVLCVLFVLGFYKRATRAFFLAISVFSVCTPRVIGGYEKVIFGGQSEPMILLFTGFCMLACAISVYALRDYDTRFCLSK